MSADLKDNPLAAHSDRKGRGHGPDPVDASGFANSMVQLLRNLPAIVLLAGVVLGLILGHYLLAAGSGISLVLLRRFSFDYRRPDGTQVRIRLDGPD